VLPTLSGVSRQFDEWCSSSFFQKALFICFHQTEISSFWQDEDINVGLWMRARRRWTIAMSRGPALGLLAMMMMSTMRLAIAFGGAQVVKLCARQPLFLFSRAARPLSLSLSLSDYWRAISAGCEMRIAAFTSHSLKIFLTSQTPADGVDTLITRPGTCFIAAKMHAEK
jgi:hypothetical protein